MAEDHPNALSHATTYTSPFLRRSAGIQCGVENEGTLSNWVTHAALPPTRSAGRGQGAPPSPTTTTAVDAPSRGSAEAEEAGGGGGRLYTTHPTPGQAVSPHGHHYSSHTTRGGGAPDEAATGRNAESGENQNAGHEAGPRPHKPLRAGGDSGVSEEPQQPQQQPQPPPHDYPYPTLARPIIVPARTNQPAVTPRDAEALTASPTLAWGITLAPSVSTSTSTSVGAGTVDVDDGGLAEILFPLPPLLSLIPSTPATPQTSTGSSATPAHQRMSAAAESVGARGGGGIAAPTHPCESQTPPTPSLASAVGGGGVGEAVSAARVDPAVSHTAGADNSGSRPTESAEGWGNLNAAAFWVLPTPPEVRPRRRGVAHRGEGAGGGGGRWHGEARACAGEHHRPEPRGERPRGWAGEESEGHSCTLADPNSSVVSTTLTDTPSVGPLYRDTNAVLDAAAVIYAAQPLTPSARLLDSPSLSGASGGDGMGGLATAALDLLSCPRERGGGLRGLDQGTSPQCTDGAPPRRRDGSRVGDRQPSDHTGVGGPTVTEREYAATASSRAPPHRQHHHHHDPQHRATTTAAAMDSTSATPTGAPLMTASELSRRRRLLDGNKHKYGFWEAAGGLAVRRAVAQAAMEEQDGSPPWVSEAASWSALGGAGAYAAGTFLLPSTAAGGGLGVSSSSGSSSAFQARHGSPRGVSSGASIVADASRAGAHGNGRDMRFHPLAPAMGGGAGPHLPLSAARSCYWWHPCHSSVALSARGRSSSTATATSSTSTNSRSSARARSRASTARRGSCEGHSEVMPSRRGPVASPRAHAPCRSGRSEASTSSASKGSSCRRRRQLQQQWRWQRRARHHSPSQPPPRPSSREVSHDGKEGGASLSQGMHPSTSARNLDGAHTRAHSCASCCSTSLSLLSVESVRPLYPEYEPPVASAGGDDDEAGAGGMEEEEEELQGMPRGPHTGPPLTLSDLTQELTRFAVRPLVARFFAPDHVHRRCGPPPEVLALTLCRCYTPVDEPVHCRDADARARAPVGDRVALTGVDSSGARGPERERAASLLSMCGTVSPSEVFWGPATRPLVLGSSYRVVPVVGGPAAGVAGLVPSLFDAILHELRARAAERARVDRDSEPVTATTVSWRVDREELRLSITAAVAHESGETGADGGVRAVWDLLRTTPAKVGTASGESDITALSVTTTAQCIACVRRAATALSLLSEREDESDGESDGGAGGGDQACTTQYTPTHLHLTLNRFLVIHELSPLPAILSSSHSTASSFASATMDSVDSDEESSAHPSSSSRHPSALERRVLARSLTVTELATTLAGLPSRKLSACNFSTLRTLERGADSSTHTTSGRVTHEPTPWPRTVVLAERCPAPLEVNMDVDTARDLLLHFPRALSSTGSDAPGRTPVSTTPSTPAPSDVTGVLRQGLRRAGRPTALSAGLLGSLATDPPEVQERDGDSLAAPHGWGHRRRRPTGKDNETPRASLLSDAPASAAAVGGAARSPADGAKDCTELRPTLSDYLFPVVTEGQGGEAVSDK